MEALFQCTHSLRDNFLPKQRCIWQYLGEILVAKVWKWMLGTGTWWSSPRYVAKTFNLENKISASSPGLSNLLCPTWGNQTSTERINYDIILLWMCFLRQWWSQYPKGEGHASPLQHSSEETRGEVSFYPSVLRVVLCILAFPWACWPP